MEFGPVPVPVDLAGTGPVPGQERVFKMAKRTVENRYSLKSENVLMLLFMKYNLRLILTSDIEPYLTYFFCINI